MNSKELLCEINKLGDKKVKALSEFNASIINVEGYRGVGIVLNNKVIVDERFNKVIYKTLEIENKHGEKNFYIFLGMKNTLINDEYGWLCLDFLTCKRDDIVSNPLNWFNRWKNLLGNSIKNKTVYDFIGEMKVLKILLKNKKNPKWDSIEKGTFDISVEKEYFEVKSSILKKETEVTIHSQFQLDVEDGKKVNLVFVRVEENENGESIDSLYNDLVELGYDQESLTQYLNENGYYEGKIERYKKFNILEIRSYPVGQEFPRIDSKSFKEDKIPLGIKKIEYIVDLNCLSYTTLEDK